MEKDSLIAGGGRNIMNYRKRRNEYRVEWRKVRLYKSMSFLRFCIRMKDRNYFPKKELKEWWRSAYYREL